MTTTAQHLHRPQHSKRVHCDDQSDGYQAVRGSLPVRAAQRNFRRSGLLSRFFWLLLLPLLLPTTTAAAVRNRTAAIRNRYVQEGFLWVGSSSSSFAKGPLWQTGDTESAAAWNATTDEAWYDHVRPFVVNDATAGEGALRRTVRDGHVDGNDDHSRKLIVVGQADTRTRVDQSKQQTKTVTESQSTPALAVAEMDYTYRKGGCTATLIGRNAAVTSAHCVYDRRSNKASTEDGWLNVTRVAPGRYRNAQGHIVDPVGTFKIEAVTVMDAWYEDQYPLYDWAVLTLLPQRKNRRNFDQSCFAVDLVYAGDVAGFLPLATPDTYASQDWPRYSRIAGYPHDKPDGQQWEARQCHNERHKKPWTNSDGKVIAVSRWDLWEQWAFHTCDTVPGMSGSALRMNDTVVGVHGYGFPELLLNGAVLFDKRYLGRLRKWANLNDDSPNRHLPAKLRKCTQPPKQQQQNDTPPRKVPKIPLFDVPNLTLGVNNKKTTESAQQP